MSGKGPNQKEEERNRQTERKMIKFLVWICAIAPVFSIQSSSGKGKQSVLIKDWINPQSEPISVKQLFIGPTSHG